MWQGWEDGGWVVERRLRSRRNSRGDEGEGAYRFGGRGPNEVRSLGMRGVELHVGG